MRINNVDSFVDRDMFLRYSGSRVGHTTQMLPAHEDTAMDLDDAGEGTNQGEGTGTEVPESDLEDITLSEELRREERVTDGWGIMDKEPTNDTDDEGCDSGIECEDSDDTVSSDSDREDEDLGSEDGEDDFYDTGYSGL